nr:uncharacterized protein LOC109163356 [Ipomoea trifida]
MRPSMCFSDSICVTPLSTVAGSVSLLTSSTGCISESVPVCVSESVPVSVSYVSSLFVSEPIPDISFVDQPGKPVSGSGLSIPVSVTMSTPSVSVSSVSFAGTETVQKLAAQSSKGKNAIISSSKRKLEDSNEVMFVSETRARKKSTPLVLVRITQSRAASVPPKSAPKSAPAALSKKSKSITFQPVLLRSALVMHRQMASSIEASLEHLRTSIAAQQDAAAGLECTLLDHYREIARLEARHAAIIAAQARTADSDLVGDDSDCLLPPRSSSATATSIEQMAPSPAASFRMLHFA